MAGLLPLWLTYIPSIDLQKHPIPFSPHGWNRWFLGDFSGEVDGPMESSSGLRVNLPYAFVEPVCCVSLSLALCFSLFFLRRRRRSNSRRRSIFLCLDIKDLPPLPFFQFIVPNALTWNLNKGSKSRDNPLS